MMMSKECTCCVLKPAILGLFCLTIIVASIEATYLAQEECDKSTCKGPIRFYNELRCAPIYKDAKDCCANAYDCTHLPAKRSSDRCSVNGHIYFIGEKLRDEDRSNACDVNCVCREDYNGGPAKFNCAIVDCFNPRPRPGCYFQRELDTCCGGREVCPVESRNPVMCSIDGTTYPEGHYFSPRANPNLSCQCRDGFREENIEPYCELIGCGLELRHSHDLVKNCAPIFYESQDPNADCNVAFRCQSSNDSVIERQKNDSDSNATPDISDAFNCIYGNLTMSHGSELNQIFEPDGSECMKCVCEVPPFLTCQKLPREQCNVPAAEQEAKQQSTSTAAAPAAAS